MKGTSARRGEAGRNDEEEEELDGGTLSFEDLRFPSEGGVEGWRDGEEGFEILGEWRCPFEPLEVPFRGE